MTVAGKNVEPSFVRFWYSLIASFSWGSLHDLLPDAAWYLVCESTSQYSGWANEQVYPVQRHRISGMWSQDESIHSIICASSVVLRISWDNPKCGRKVVVVTNFHLETTLFGTWQHWVKTCPSESVCVQTPWRQCCPGLVVQRWSLLLSVLFTSAPRGYARGSIPSLSHPHSHHVWHVPSLTLTL